MDIFTAPAVTLDTLKEIASRAWSGTSFSPERRAADFLASYTTELNSDRASIYATARSEEAAAEQATRYTSQYIEHLRGMLAARGRCLSSMITGASNFPTERNRKRLDAEHNKTGDFLEWQPKALRAAIKRTQPEAAQTDLEIAQAKLANLIKSQAIMKAVNVAIKKSKNDTEAGQLNAVISAGLSEKLATEILKPDYAGRTGFAAYVLSNNNSEITRMKKRVADLDAKQAASTNAASTAPATFDGGEVVQNFEADRVQIFFDSIPSDDTREQLRGAGWNWSRTNEAWQRKLTEAAKQSAERITGASFAGAPRLVAEQPAAPVSDPHEFQVKENTTTTENGFLLTQHPLKVSDTAICILSMLRQAVKAAPLPSAGSWAEWLALAVGLDKLAAASKGEILTDVGAGYISVSYHPGARYEGQPLLEITAATAPAPTPPTGNTIPKSPEVQQRNATILAAAAAVEQFTATFDKYATPAPTVSPAADWYASIKANQHTPEQKAAYRSPAEVTPEQFAANEAATAKAVDLANLDYLINYHGPATAEQLAQLSTGHPLNEARAAAHAAKEAAAALTLDAAQLATVPNYHGPATARQEASLPDAHPLSTAAIIAPHLAQKAAEESAALDAAQLATVPNYHGPATLNQLRGLGHWHDLTEAHRSASATALAARRARTYAARNPATVHRQQQDHAPSSWQNKQYQTAGTLASAPQLSFF